MRALFLATALFTAATPALAAEDVSTLLKRQTQAMYDALSPADPRVWDTMLDADALVTDENGVFTNKKDTVAQVTPLPKGISGHIAITDWRISLHGDVAVTAFISDEHEDFHGQHLHAQYRETCMWVKTPARWKILGMHTIALQQDPPAVQLSDAALDQYAGRYQAAPDLVYEITRKSHDLVAGVVGGKPGAMKMELLDVAFAPGQPRVRKLFQRDAAGHIAGFLSRREGRDVIWKKIN